MGVGRGHNEKAGEYIAHGAAVTIKRDRRTFFYTFDRAMRLTNTYQNCSVASDFHKDFLGGCATPFERANMDLSSILANLKGVGIIEKGKYMLFYRA